MITRRCVCVRKQAASICCRRIANWPARKSNWSSKSSANSAQAGAGEGGEEYDFILIDCPPALNLLTVNALTCAHAVLIPMQCEYFAIEGLADLVNTIKKIKARLNPGLVIDGVVRVMFDNRNTLAQHVSDQLKAHFGAKVFDTVVPRNVRLAEAPSHGLAVLQYDRASKGAQAYYRWRGNC
jgi:chromosome partitioning protein